MHAISCTSLMQQIIIYIKVDIAFRGLSKACSSTLRRGYCFYLRQMGCS